MVNKGDRLDQLLVKRGLYKSRSRAKAAIMAGIIFVDGERVDKAGTSVAPEADIEIQGPTNPYVSRGGLKLARALDGFDVTVKGRICLDVGASTGGFTDCLLDRGAKKVYSVDVGYGQLAWKLRQDSRVVVMERTNFRHVDPNAFLGVELAVIDVSFISLTKILPRVAELLPVGGDVIALIKPQFEAGRERVGKGGVVRDAAVHCSVLTSILDGAAVSGWTARNLIYSPITGPQGNIEFLVWWQWGGLEGKGEALPLEDVRGLVEAAHGELVE